MIDEELQEKMAEYDSMEFKKFSRYALRVKAMQSLGGLIAGMVIDDVIDDLEVAELRKWLQVNRKHFNDHQMKEVFALIEHILADGKVSNEEMEDLKWLAKRMVDHHDVGDLVTIALRILEGIFHGILAGSSAFRLRGQMLVRLAGGYAVSSRCVPIRRNTVACDGSLGRRFYR